MSTHLSSHQPLVAAGEGVGLQMEGVELQAEEEVVGEVGVEEVVQALLPSPPAKNLQRGKAEGPMKWAWPHAHYLYLLPLSGETTAPLLFFRRCTFIKVQLKTDH